MTSVMVCNILYLYGHGILIGLLMELGKASVYDRSSLDLLTLKKEAKFIVEHGWNPGCWMIDKSMAEKNVIRTGENDITLQLAVIHIYTSFPKCDNSYLPISYYSGYRTMGRG